MNRKFGNIHGIKKGSSIRYLGYKKRERKQRQAMKVDSEAEHRPLGE